MAELANIFETVGVGIGLLIFILAGFIAIVIYLAKSNKDVAKNLELKDAERKSEREQYEKDLKELMSKSNDVYLQVAKSNQNIADALVCIKLLVDDMIKKFYKHDERAIGIDSKITEVKMRVENCDKNRK